MKTNKVFTITAVIIFFALNLFVRFYGLENSPASLGFDEASLGYNAYSLMQTGRDEWGNYLPLSLRSFGDYKPALYAYSAIPFIKVFGLSQASVRMPSAFWGAIASVFLLLIFKRITKTSWPVAFFVSVFIALSPWRLHFSRVALETNLASSFFTIMVWFLVNRQKHRFYRLGTILFGALAIYSYHSARVAVPAMLLLVALDPLGRRIKKQLFFPLILILVLSLPIFIANGNDVFTRFNQTNLFSKFYPFTPKEIISGPNPWLSLTNNPLYYLSGHLFGRMIAYLSPHNLSETFYPWVVKSAMVIVRNGSLGFLGTIFFIFGLKTLLKSLDQKNNHRLLLYWLIAGALPAAVTWEWFHPFRALNLFPTLDLISGLGLLLLIKHLRRWAIILVILMIPTLLFNWLNEINYSVWENNGEFQPGGFREGVTTLMTLAEKYPVIYVDTPQLQSYIFFLFYGKIDPSVIQNTIRLYHHPEGFSDRVFDFGKFVYKKFSWPEDQLKHNYIYYTQSEIKEYEFKDYTDTKLYKVIDPFGRWSATIITKD